jgi:uncharacterized membrane protein
MTLVRGSTAMIKTLIFAAAHFTVAYALTGDLLVGGTLALLEPAINTAAYHFHERIWARIRGPRRNSPGVSLVA